MSNMDAENKTETEMDRLDEVADLVDETVELSKRWRAYGAKLSEIDLEVAVKVLQATLAMQDSLRSTVESLAEHSHLPDDMPELKFE